MDYEHAADRNDIPYCLTVAMKERRSVRIVYVSRHRGYPDRTERVVEPLYVRNRLLVAKCHLRRAERHFRLDRIEECKILSSASESSLAEASSTGGGSGNSHTVLYLLLGLVIVLVWIGLAL